jgi:hypothetical protein
MSPSQAQLSATALNWIVAFVSCALVAGVIDRALPLPKVRGVYEKYQYFAAHRDRYDLLFVGSSRFFHQIDPRQFDARMAELGCPNVHSFNFGVDAMWPPESFYVLRKILALRPPKLRWVVIEMMEIHVKDIQLNPATMRHAYWHDWPHTRLACEALIGSKFSPQQKWDLALGHVAHFARTTLNFGRGADWLSGCLTHVKKSTIAKDWISADGFEPLPKRTMSATEIVNYERAVARSRQKMKPQPLRPPSRKAFTELIQDIRALGAEPIFVVTPTLLRMENFTEAPNGATLFTFNDPNVYPELFEVTERYDTGHLDAKGAVKFTDLLAGRVAKRVMPQP